MAVSSANLIQILSADNRICHDLDLSVRFRVFSGMDISSRPVAAAVIFILAFVLNLFFGYFRAKARKYSLKWFLFIHLPIPIVVFARLYTNLDFRYIPLFLAAAIAGQIIGGKLEL
jgi:hypothetical protein